MPIDVTEPGSPGWWVQRLLRRLADRRDRYDLLERYYVGTPDIPVNTNKAVRQAYQRLMAMARTNYAELIVEAVRERMSVVGFRTGAGDDELGDSEAWRIWQANSLDADSQLVHRTSLVMGDAYVIVGGPDEETGAPLITPEDPRQVIAEYDPVRRRRPVAALKVFSDDVAGADRLYLYLPGAVIRAARPTPVGGSLMLEDMSGWEWDPPAEALPAGVVPVVGFPNRSSLDGGTFGEFEPHTAVLDRINYTLLNRLEIATLQAFRQRAVKGVPNVDAQGNDIDYSDIFASDPGAMWLLPDTAELWESGQVDLGPLRQAIRDDVQDLAAASRTPLFYLTPDAANGSAEGASLAREGLVHKTADRIVQASEAWEQVMSLAFLFAGDPTRAQRRDMEAIWAPPERFSLSERYDAASKAQAAGVPWRSVMSSVLQFSPQEVARMEAERAMDAFLSSVPVEAPAAPQAPPVINVEQPARGRRSVERDAAGNIVAITEE